MRLVVFRFGGRSVRTLWTFLYRYEALLYLLLAFPLLVFLQRAVRAWQALRSATFALEWESARQRLVQNVLAAFSVLALMTVVFLGSALGSPEYSQMLLATPTLTPQAQAEGTGTPEATPTPTPLPAVDPAPENCVPGRVNFLSPTNQATVQGKIEVRGSASIPDFAFYQIDIAPKGSALFLTIGVGREPVQEGTLLPEWDTTMLTPGEYLLQLLVVNTAGKAEPPCRILIRVEPPES